MALSEIEKLERRYAENPQGLTFAPLAEVHRKNGDVTRALELLRPGLELHPNYIPASIVLGRCQLDLSDLPAAEAAFAHVLALDGENVIALKALADISERQHRFDQAERWLRTLLSVDRSNDEARAQLERIENARRDSEAAPSVPALQSDQPAGGAEPATTSEAVEVAEPEAIAPAAGSEVEAPAPTPSVEPVAGWVSGPETMETSPLPLADLETDYARDEGSGPAPAGLEIEESLPIKEAVEPLAGIIGRDVDTPDLVHDEFRVEQSEDIVLSSSGGHEFQVPDASLELSDRIAPTPPPSPFGVEAPPMFGGLEETPTVPQPTGEAVKAAEPAAEAPPIEPVTLDEPTKLEEPIASAEEPPGPVEAEPKPVAQAQPEPIPAEEPVHEAPASETRAAPDVIVAPEPEPVVTETMAEVLLQQGHSVEALQVYRELDAQRAGDAHIRERIAAIEEEHRMAAREPEPAAEPEPAPVARRQYIAAETGGQSVAGFFRALLAARPPAVASAPAAARASAPQAQADSAGAPTRPAADALSLSSVFGEETTPLPPAVPAGGAAQSSGVSFDEFYSPPGQSAAAHKSRSPDPKNDDLDQFHAWLQNLKR